MAGLRVGALALLLACSCAAPQPALVHFDRSSIVSFDYPAAWKEGTYPLVFSFQVFITFLSSESLSNPCGTATDGSCLHGPLAPLERVLPTAGFLIIWSVNSPMGWQFDSTAGQPIVVDGVQSTIEELPAEGYCQTLGATTQVTLIVPWEEAPNQFTQMAACINGAFDGELETQLKDMLASVQWLHGSS